MGRTLKRVPLDFDHPIKSIWPGYTNEAGNRKPCTEPKCADGALDECGNCYGEAYTWEPVEPPTGAGFQMWETTSEGSPQTPVFETLAELSAFCAENRTTFASFTATAEEWEQMLTADSVHHRDGNMVFI